MLSEEEIKKEYESLLKQLSDPELVSNWEKFEELSKRKKVLEEIIEKQKEIKEIEKQIKESKSILSSGEDGELVVLAEADVEQLQEKEKTLQKELEESLNDKEEVRPEKRFDSVVIEIRAGTGGQEAALFAADLFNMYSKYALLKGWKQKVLDSHSTDLGGVKEITFEIKDKNAFSELKHEAGVHRVQRIPETEKSGRIHTSTATVAILPKPKATEVKIRPEDLKIDIFKSSGPGGQNVNKRETAVRITHLPTGIVVASQTERTQPRNKENALSILAARIYEKKEQEEISKIAGKRKIQIGGAERAEKIRTYNFPQGRITDHRIKKTWHNLGSILDGNIYPILKSLENYYAN